MMWIGHSLIGIAIEGDVYFDGLERMEELGNLAKSQLRVKLHKYMIAFAVQEKLP